LLLGHGFGFLLFGHGFGLSVAVQYEINFLRCFNGSTDTEEMSGFVSRESSSVSNSISDSKSLS